MSLGFDALSENPLSALSAAGFSASATAGQGGETAIGVAALQFGAAISAGQGSQSANIAALLQFIAMIDAGDASQTAAAAAYVQQLVGGAVSSGQGSETASVTALLQFIASATAGQASQTTDATAQQGKGFFGTCTAGQGAQTTDGAAALTGLAAYLDGAGIGRGNKSWWQDKEIVVDHRITHKGHIKTGQASQGAECMGGVRNPFTLVVVNERQFGASVSARGDITDPELEEFTMMAAAMLDDAWREAA